MAAKYATPYGSVSPNRTRISMVCERADGISPTGSPLRDALSNGRRRERGNTVKGKNAGPPPPRYGPPRGPGRVLRGVLPGGEGGPPGLAGPEPHRRRRHRPRDPRDARAAPLRRLRLHHPVLGAAARLRPRAGGPPALRADPAATASRQRRRRLPVRRDALRAFLRHVSSRGKLPRGHPGDRREDPHGADGEKPHGK